MSGQRKIRIREKDRERYAKKHQRQETANARDSSANTTVSVISPNAVKQKAHRVKKHLPASPNKFAQVLKHVVCNATPRKKGMLVRTLCKFQMHLSVQCGSRSKNSGTNVSANGKWQDVAWHCRSRAQGGQLA